MYRGSLDSKDISPYTQIHKTHGADWCALDTDRASTGFQIMQTALSKQASKQVPYKEPQDAPQLALNGGVSCLRGSPCAHSSKQNCNTLPTAATNSKPEFPVRQCGSNHAAAHRIISNTCQCGSIANRCCIRANCNPDTKDVLIPASTPLCTLPNVINLFLCFLAQKITRRQNKSFTRFGSTGPPFKAGG